MKLNIHGYSFPIAAKPASAILAPLVLSSSYYTALLRQFLFTSLHWLRSVDWLEALCRSSHGPPGLFSSVAGSCVVMVPLV